MHLTHSRNSCCRERPWDTVDFQSVDVSVWLVNCVTSSFRIRKSLMFSAILISFTFGAFAISLAYESASEQGLYGVLSYHASGDGLLRSEPFSPRLAVICLSGDVPRSAQPNLQADRINYVRLADAAIFSFFLENHVPKVSLQILQSVLLI